jgi:hypothetical protein
MILSVDSANYLPLLEPQDTETAKAITSNASLSTNALPTELKLPITAKGKAPQGFSLTKLQKIFDSVTRMLEALALVLQQRNATKATTTPNAPANTTAPTQTSSPIPAEPWLAPVDQEPGLIIPDLESSSVTPPDTSQIASTSDGNPPGAATVPIDAQEQIPDLSDAPRPITSTKQYTIGTRLKGSGQFLWKPVSDKDGKLAILTPPKLTGKIKNVVILSPDKTQILGKGSFSGVGNGDREHFRFSKSGAQYPDKSIVLITLKDGSTQHVPIRESSARYSM